MIGVHALDQDFYTADIGSFTATVAGIQHFSKTGIFFASKQDINIAAAMNDGVVLVIDQDIVAAAAEKHVLVFEVGVILVFAVAEKDIIAEAAEERVITALAFILFQFFKNDFQLKPICGFVPKCKFVTKNILKIIPCITEQNIIAAPAIHEIIHFRACQYGGIGIIFGVRAIECIVHHILESVEGDIQIGVYRLRCTRDIAIAVRHLEREVKNRLLTVFKIKIVELIYCPFAGAWIHPDDEKRVAVKVGAVFAIGLP